MKHVGTGLYSVVCRSVISEDASFLVPNCPAVMPQNGSGARSVLTTLYTLVMCWLPSMILWTCFIIIREGDNGERQQRQDREWADVQQRLDLKPL